MANSSAFFVNVAATRYRELAIKGLPAFHEHYRLFHTVPDISAEKGEETPTEDNPLTPNFWKPEKSAGNALI